MPLLLALDGIAQQTGQAPQQVTALTAYIAQPNQQVAEDSISQRQHAEHINQRIQAINTATDSLTHAAMQGLSDSGDISQTASMLMRMSTSFGEIESQQQHKNGEVDLF